VGPRLSLVLGVGWPVVVGAIALLVARRNLQRSDLAG
jgi:hypothetical protein